MRNFLSLEENICGMEVTDETVRIIELGKFRGKFSIDTLASAKIEAGAVRNGEIKDEAKLIKFIYIAVAAAGKKLKNRRVVISLPENKSFLQVVSMPRLGEEELRQAVTFEAENYIPLPLEKVYLDFEEIPSNPALKREEILLAAMPREIVDSRIRVAQSAGLIPVAMELESQAIVRALVFSGLILDNAAIIQIGDSKANFIICARGSIRFTFSIPISNRYFLETIAASADVDMGKAQELKSECGIKEFIQDAQNADNESTNSAVTEKRKIFEALIPGLVDLVQQMGKCIQYFQTHEMQNPGSDKSSIDKIFVCGSGSDLKGLEEFIALKLGVKTERVPSTLFGQKITEANSCEFIVAAGLALRNFDLQRRKIQTNPAAAERRSRPKKIAFANMAKKTASAGLNMISK